MVGEDYQKCKQDTTPLAKEDELHVFDLAPPNLFSPDFARKSKEFMGQLKVQRSAIPPKWKKPTNVPFFGIPFSKKGYRPRSAGTNSYRGGRRSNRGRHTVTDK